MWAPLYFSQQIPEGMCCARSQGGRVLLFIYTCTGTGGFAFLLLRTHGLVRRRGFRSARGRHSTTADKVRTASQQAYELRRILMLLAPSVLIIEQTDGLRTHCPSAYALYHSIFDGTPYCLFHSTVDAAACGGTHSRERLIWVAVR